jgi:hypothetical protein
MKIMCLQEYGHTKIQKEIIKLGRENRLTVKKIQDLFGRENVRNLRDARFERWKLFEMKLVKWDEKTLDKEGNINENSRLIWIHKGDKLPMDPGEAKHDSASGFMYEQEEQFYQNFNKHICQKCGKKCKDFFYVNTRCEPCGSNHEGIDWLIAPHFMVVLCKNCHKELVQWLNIATQDVMADD